MLQTVDLPADHRKGFEFGESICFTFDTNLMHLFLAEGCVKVAEQKLDENEHLSVMTVPLSTAVDMVMDGRINANTAAHLILKTEKLLPDLK